MKTLLASCLLFLLSITSFYSQDISWINQPIDSVWNVIETNEVGTSYLSNNNILEKYDNLGGLQWQLQFDSVFYSAMAVDSMGNLIAAGRLSATSNLNPNGAAQWHSPIGAHEMLIAKYSSNGDLIFAFTLIGASYNYIHDVVLDSSGFYITGVYNDSLDFDPSGGVHIHSNTDNSGSFIAKYNLNGDFLWVTDVSDDAVVSYELCSYPGGVYVSGTFGLTVDFDPSIGVISHSTSGGGSNGFVSNFDASGTYNWTRIIGSFDATLHPQIDCDIEGNVYMAEDLLGGSSSLYYDDNGSQVSFNHFGTSNFYILKYNDQGDLLESQFSDGTGYYSVWDLRLNGNDDKVVLSGAASDLELGPSIVDSMVSGFSNDLYYLELDSNLVYQRAGLVGCTSFDRGRQVFYDNGNNLYLLGDFVGSAGGSPCTFNVNGSPQDFYNVGQLVMKVGNAPVGLDDYSSRIQLSAYPNPFMFSTTIEFDSQVEVESIIVTNMLGKIFKRIPVHLKQGRVEVDLSEATSGIYIVQVGELSFVKLIKE